MKVVSSDSCYSCFQEIELCDCTHFIYLPGLALPPGGGAHFLSVYVGQRL